MTTDDKKIEKMKRTANEAEGTSHALCINFWLILVLSYDKMTKVWFQRRSFSLLTHKIIPSRLKSQLEYKNNDMKIFLSKTSFNSSTSVAPILVDLLTVVELY